MKKIISLTIFLCLILTTPCFAEDDPILLNPTVGITPPTIDEGLAGTLGDIITIVQIVGTAVAVGASIYLGIRYVISSVAEKADIKKKMMPFVGGVVLFYGATAILQIIAKIGNFFNGLPQ